MKKRFIAGLSALVISGSLLLSACSAGDKAVYDSNASAITTESWSGSAAPMAPNGGYGYSDSYYSKGDYITDDFDYDYSYDNGMRDESEGIYEEAPAASASDSYDTAVQSTGRKLIKNVSMAIQTLNFDAAIAEIEAKISALGGYVENSNTYSNNFMYTESFRHNRSASYTLRVPAEKLSSFTSAIGQIGSITHQSMYTEDVTLSYVDTESRAESLRIQQQKLLAFMAEAETVEDIIALQDRISEVTYQLERNERILRNYDNLCVYSTINLSIEEVEHITVEATEPETLGQRISSGLSDTFYDLRIGFTNFFVNFIVDLPYILIWALVIAIIVFIVLKVRKRLIRKAVKKADSKVPQAPSKGDPQDTNSMDNPQL